MISLCLCPTCYRKLEDGRGVIRSTLRWWYWFCPCASIVMVEDGKFSVSCDFQCFVLSATSWGSNCFICFSSTSIIISSYQCLKCFHFLEHLLYCFDFSCRILGWIWAMDICNNGRIPTLENVALLFGW